MQSHQGQLFANFKNLQKPYYKRVRDTHFFIRQYYPQATDRKSAEIISKSDELLITQEVYCQQTCFSAIVNGATMLDLSAQRKTKLNLSDYDWERDVQHRTFFSDLKEDEFLVIDELLYSPLKTSAKKLARTLEMNEERLREILEKLAAGSLLKREADLLLIDKDTRKSYELQMERLRPDFRPDVEFMQGLLKKVPIHVLPSWYAISRTSDNIFQSILDKYLITPQAFQRYLADLSFPESWMALVVRDLFAGPDLKISSSDCISRYNLTRKAFDRMALYLEFSFVACLTYEKKEGRWVEFLSPFHEWRQYLAFLRKTASKILEDSLIQNVEGEDFFFVRKLSSFLENPKTFSPLLEKAILLNFLTKEKKLTNEGAEWLQLSLEKKALSLYRSPFHRVSSMEVGGRSIREAEKTVKRVLHGGWVLFEDFFQGITSVFQAEQNIVLKKIGKTWTYTLPSYTEEEKEFIFATLFEYLKEAGMTATGTFEGKPCFRITQFGRFFFED